MTSTTPHSQTTDSSTPAFLRRDPSWEERKRTLWAMTPHERVAAMRAGRLTMRECLHWASQTPEQVPLLEDEYEFLALTTPEIADR